MALDYFAADCQPHTGTRYFSSVETLEESKNRFVVLLVNTDAVVADAEDPVVFIFLSPDLYARRCLRTVLNCIADEVLENLHDLRPTGHSEIAAFRR